MLLQGLCLFCLNYLAVYAAEQYLTSGLVAVTFSLLAMGNIIGLRVFFGQQINPVNLLGAILGLMGIALLFWPELRGLEIADQRARGMLLAVAATVSATPPDARATPMTTRD